MGKSTCVYDEIDNTKNILKNLVKNCFDKFFSPKFFKKNSTFAILFKKWQKQTNENVLIVRTKINQS